MTPAQREALVAARKALHGVYGTPSTGSWVLDLYEQIDRALTGPPSPTPQTAAPVTREQLASIEWVRHSCPECRAPESDGHDHDCWLARALSAAPPAPTPPSVPQKQWGAFVTGGATFPSQQPIAAPAPTQQFDLDTATPLEACLYAMGREIEQIEQLPASALQTRLSLILSTAMIELWRLRQSLAAPEPIGPQVVGTLSKDDPGRIFVEGAQWLEYERSGGTMWTSDRHLVEAEAERRYPAPALPPAGKCPIDGGDTFDGACSICRITQAALLNQCHHCDERPPDQLCRWCGRRGTGPVLSPETRQQRYDSQKAEVAALPPVEADTMPTIEVGDLVAINEDVDGGSRVYVLNEAVRKAVLAQSIDEIHRFLWRRPAPTGGQ